MSGAHRNPPTTLADVMAEQRRRRFVGRSAELELFTDAVTRATGRPFSVLHIHGPGGVGKTSLLDAFEVVAVAHGATVVRLDGLELDPSPRNLLEALSQKVFVPPGHGPIRSRTAGSPIVLLVDAYEALASLDPWFRSALVPRLPASAVTVFAGRDTPSRAWRGDPAWSSLLRVISLRNLDPDESRDYLRAAGVAEVLHESVLKLTYGHPLALALLADVVTSGGRIDSGTLPLDLVEILLPRFVEGVPGIRHRRALAACAIARRTTEALLRDVLDESDERDVFDWLRALSFIEARPEGLAPHDLVRDVLDADLRWRDFDTYADVFRRVRGHTVAALRTSTGRAQQRAIVDLKFLFRQVRSVLSPVAWDSWGEHLPEPAGPQDVDDVLELVSRWEGNQSAKIAAAWLADQPGGFWVLHDARGGLQGVVGIIELTRSAGHRLEQDPGARAAWEYAQRHAPPRPGETLTVCRFVVDRDHYQGPSPTLNGTPILTLQRELTEPRLSWDFLCLAEPDRWNDYFAAADLPRAEGADFTVAGRQYGLFAHDFRELPVEAVTELWTERALAQDVALGPRRPDHPRLVLSFSDFDAAVRQGLKDLHRPDLLARNPLTRARLVVDRLAPGASSAAALGSLLREAVATLAEDPRDDRLLRAVDVTYLRSAATQEAAAARLGLPFSTYRRHLGQGIARIVSGLWDGEVYGQERAEVDTR